MKKTLTSEEEMKAFGRQIGGLLKGGEFIELIGDVGAGKTTFTKGLASGMGITDTVQSPTFTISRVYDTPSDLILAHYDFYRLPDPGIMADELAETANDPRTVIVIEWGEAVRDVRPEDVLQLNFASSSETTRELEIAASGERSKRIIEELS